MKRYQFNLATVLRARRAQEEVARGDLMLAHQAATQAAAAVAESRAHYESNANAVGNNFMAHRQRWELAGQAVSDAGQAEIDAQAGVASAMDRYLNASRSVSVIEHLDEHRRQEHAAAAQREESAFIDELVTGRYARSQQQAKLAGARQGNLVPGHPQDRGRPQGQGRLSLGQAGP